MQGSAPLARYDSRWWCGWGFLAQLWLRAVTTKPLACYSELSLSGRILCWLGVMWVCLYLAKCKLLCMSSLHVMQWPLHDAWV